MWWTARYTLTREAWDHPEISSTAPLSHLICGFALTLTFASIVRYILIGQISAVTGITALSVLSVVSLHNRRKHRNELGKNFLTASDGSEGSNIGNWNDKRLTLSVLHGLRCMLGSSCVTHLHASFFTQDRPAIVCLQRFLAPLTLSVGHGMRLWLAMGVEDKAGSNDGCNVLQRSSLQGAMIFTWDRLCGSCGKFATTH
ncbi:hypothetical protein BDN71DRAFT_1432601 [Pleurotus eryngii]|uniref:Uncharacterized protein n=1 Tax=Pleurotus eryngii TaxID=5323 RepID=A0A9P5ZWV9_PLEER|nr:hypothetical protein BDN71DRAFT_1432601 [Pleurotus eryngii]